MIWYDMLCYVMIYNMIWYMIWYVIIHAWETLHFILAVYSFLRFRLSNLQTRKKYSFVVSAITRSRFRRHLPVVPSEYHSLLEGTQDAGWVWASDSSERYVTTRNWSLLFFGEYLVSWGLVMRHNWRRDFSEIILRILYILRSF